ncbi:uncharacterized protein C18orf63-like [Diachasmimorpha longicaudata]|uniref:uncharacterized protein C18orf63-like n=1 Tax=Diachasmimorpha longicaudata TaxID=58733 RepID=UPI0030B903EE
MESSDYYVKVPPRSSLCCTICTVDPDEIRDSSAKSYFHWKTLKCRYIINLMPSTVIASPIHKSKGAFYVITTRSFYNTGMLQKNLMKINLTHSAQQIVTPQAYLDCLRYTFEFYMSPMWNKVFNIYMEGANFLHNSEFNAAITSTISLTSRETSPQDEIRMRLTSLAAKLPPLKLENMAILSMAIGPFLQDPEGVLDVSRFVMLKVNVIPSMKKAIIRRVMKKIPPNCAFQNYRELRRHWKNMYGYRLPKTDEGILYYEVYFPIPCATVEYLIYPDICVRRDLSQRPAEPGDHLKQKFLQDFLFSMPTVLDQPLEISQSSQQDNSLSQGFQKASQIEPSGLTTPFPNDSARLSLSGGPLKKDVSTQMSPTASLRGYCPDNEKKKLKFDNLKKIQQIHNVVPSTSFRAPKGGVKAPKPVKMFLSESEMSQYFQNSSGSSQNKNINIFNLYDRKKDNFDDVKGGTFPRVNEEEGPREDGKRSKVKVVSVSSGTYPWFK